jgi:acetylornithine/N-succinyldiaminopimelate aminotransferase
MNLRQLFLQHIAQTTDNPLAIEFVKAECCTLYDANGKTYLDLIAGISVCNIGHSHPKVVEAITKQASQFMHTMVYGELVQSPQVLYAQQLISLLPSHLNCVHFTNSGAEATEGAMKLAKRATGRSKIIAANNSYHGSTQGALSIMGSEYWRNAFRPLLPNVFHEDFNSQALINQIDIETACVIIEVVQAETGINTADKIWLQQVRDACTKHGALLIFDEIQTGFGRTGKMFAFEHYSIFPDVLLLGKALGGGMPLGAFIASKTLLNTLATNPILGNISTFAGHPVSCAAGHAALNVLINEGWINTVAENEAYLKMLLNNLPNHKSSVFGLWAAVNFDSFETNKKIVDFCISKGVFTDWFLFNANALRISPPLIIHQTQLKYAVSVIEEGIAIYCN